MRIYTYTCIDHTDNDMVNLTTFFLSRDISSYQKYNNIFFFCSSSIFINALHLNLIDASCICMPIIQNDLSKLDAFLYLFSSKWFYNITIHIILQLVVVEKNDKGLKMELIIHSWCFWTYSSWFFCWQTQPRKRT